MEITLRKEKIDWLKIIDLVLNRQDWGKTYLLYSYGTTTITCMMKEFNFEDQVAWFRVRVEYVVGKEKCSDTTLVRYALNNFTLEDFKGHLNSSLKTLLDFGIESQTKNKAYIKYRDLFHTSFDITKDEIIGAGFEEDYNTAMTMGNENIQEACLIEINNQVQETLNYEYDNCVSDYCRNHKVVIEGFKQIMETIENE